MESMPLFGGRLRASSSVILSQSRGRVSAQRSRHMSRIVTVGCAVSLLALGMAAPLASSASGTSEPSWSVVTSTAPPGALSSVSCVSTLECFAVGTAGPQNHYSVVYLTENGGSSWVSQTLRSSELGESGLNDIACPSTGECIAVGSQLDVSDAGVGTAYATTNGGTTWVSQTLPSGVEGLTDIACTSTSDCIAGGTNTSGAAIIATTNGGSSWTNESVPSGASDITGGIACPSASDCFIAAGSDQILATTNGGMTWAIETLSGPNGLDGIACSSTTDCLVDAHSNSGPYVEATTDGGTTWVSHSPLVAGYGGLSGMWCSSSSDCVTVGVNGNIPATGVIDVTADGGTTWSSEVLPTGVPNLDAVTCTSSDRCIAVGGEGANGVGGIILVNTPPPVPSIITKFSPFGHA